MNADVAKPIPRELVYSEMAVDVDQSLAAMRPCGNCFMATMSHEFSPRECCDATLPRRAFANEGKRPPDCGIGVSRRGRIVEIGQHRSPQRFGTADSRFGFEQIESRNGE